MPTELYICKRGDSFIKIALNKFGDIYRAEEIAELNNTNATAFLDEGQRIIIPTNH